MATQKRPAKKTTKKAAPSEAAASKRSRAGTAPKSRAKSDEAPAQLPQIAFASTSDFARWLTKHHASSRGIWLQLMKKDSGRASVTYQEALGVALAWGWIDGQLKSFDAHSWLRKFTPRGPRSIWSKINRDKALALIAAGEMKPAGLVQVEKAKADGRWDAAYDSAKTAQIPADLAAALAKSPRAKAFFAELEARNRYAVLFRVQAPKKAETRARKLLEIVAMLERGEKFHP